MPDAKPPASSTTPATRYGAALSGLHKWARPRLLRNRIHGSINQLSKAALPAATYAAAVLIAARAGLMTPTQTVALLGPAVLAVGSYVFVTGRRQEGFTFEDGDLLTAADRAADDAFGRIRSGLELATETPDADRTAFTARAIEDGFGRLKRVNGHAFRTALPNSPVHPFRLLPAAALVMAACLVPMQNILMPARDGRTNSDVLAINSIAPGERHARPDANPPEPQTTLPSARQKVAESERTDSNTDGGTKAAGSAPADRSNADIKSNASPAGGSSTAGEGGQASAKAGETADGQSPNTPAAAPALAKAAVQPVTVAPINEKVGRSTAGLKTAGQSGDKPKDGQSGGGDSAKAGPPNEDASDAPRQGGGNQKKGTSAVLDQGQPETTAKPKNTTIARGTQGSDGAEMSLDPDARSAGGERQADRKQRGVAPQILGVPQPDVVRSVGSRNGPETRTPRTVAPRPENVPSPGDASPSAGPAPAPPPADRYTVPPEDRDRVAAYFRAIESTGKK